MRLTHEELVQAQGDLLRTAESLDVTKREISRIEDLARDGAIAGKTLIDLNYEKQKSEAVLRAQSQTLVLHGLTEDQVADILKTRKLLPKLSVSVPEVAADEKTDSTDRTLQVQELRVEQGQHVTAGDVLFILADHRELFIEGKAFEQDVQAVSKAVAEDWKVSAIIESKATRPEDIVSDLSVLYMANKVDPDSRCVSVLCDSAEPRPAREAGIRRPAIPRLGVQAGAARSSAHPSRAMEGSHRAADRSDRQRRDGVIRVSSQWRSL